VRFISIVAITGEFKKQAEEKKTHFDDTDIWSRGTGRFK
jgi:hypothetical protein